MFKNDSTLIVMLCLIVSIAMLAYLAYRFFRNPFRYPYFVHKFDITSKRNVNVEDYIDNFLRDEQSWRRIQLHEQHIQNWKAETENYIKNCMLQKYRAQQYQRILDDEQAYLFQMIRKQTRYRQRNYVKTSYKVSVVDTEWVVNWQWLQDRHNKLEEIGFEATLREYHSKSQRKLMTPLMRKQIMERDNYTCQLCGKYMADEVGLQIDHIVPIAKGGKSVPSNLRVLCSKCNGSKGAR